MKFGSLRPSTHFFLAFGVVVLLSFPSSGRGLGKLGVVHSELTHVVKDNDVRINFNLKLPGSVHTSGLASGLARNSGVVAQMDRVTPLNSPPVEEITAAADSLNVQAQVAASTGTNEWERC